MFLIMNCNIIWIVSHSGTDVVIVKSGRRICGTGGCLANAPLHQNKSYFEFKIQSTGKLQWLADLLFLFPIMHFT